MTDLRGAGNLRELLSFQKRQEIEDNHGNVVNDFVEQFRRPAGMSALRGGEAVQASRLQGTQPYIVTVRYDLAVATVTTDWRVVDTRTGTAYAITTFVPRPKKDYVDLMCVSGVAETE